MRTLKHLLQSIAVILVFCSHCIAQGEISQGSYEDNPVTFRDVSPAKESVTIPLKGYSKTNNSRYGMMITIAGGTYEVGYDQPVLKKLTDVAAQLNGAIVTGDVIYELNATYDGTTGETFPLVFNEFTSSGGSWSVTIRVKAGVSTRNTTGNLANPLIVFDGADNLILDGRAGGTGSSVAWNLYNSNADGTVALFINDAQSNTMQYCDLVSLHKSLGVITFGSTSGTEGNDNNTIAWCNIHDNGTDSPGIGIYSLGNFSSETSFNSGNNILNCNLYNIYRDGGITDWIFADKGTTGWVITGNSFYQTIPRSPTGAFTNFTMVDILSGEGYTISNNYFGGSAPQCGGSPFTINNMASDKTLYAIAFSSGLPETAINTIQGNTITNIYYELYNSSPSRINIISFAGILIADGIHNITNNTIGSATANGAIYVKSGPGWGNHVNGIFYQYGLGGQIENNVVGGFKVEGSPMIIPNITNVMTVTMVYLNQVANIIPLTFSNNLIGSLATPSSIQCTLMTGATGHLRLQGLLISTNPGMESMTVINNTVANMVLNSFSSQSYLKGFVVNSYYSGAAITGNIVRDLANNAPNTQTILMCSVIGLQFNMFAPGAISQNAAYNLQSTNTTAATLMAGCVLQSGPSNGSAILERTFIHNLNNASTSVSAHIYGLNIAGGSYILRNNMVSLGIKPDGSAITTGLQLTGILDVNGNNNFYNNSVYVGGAVASGATGNTACFNSTATASIRKVTDNIFFNARSGGTAGKHYAIRFTNANPVIVTCNNNLLLANGAVGGTLASNGTTNYVSLSAWSIATGMDMASGVGNPNFINPAGSAATANLHVQSPTPVESGGVVLADVSADYDGSDRSGLTPADIGADAGNFITSGDIFGPMISYPLLQNSTTANRILTDFAVISDNIAVAAGDLRPRFYFKRSTDANAFVGNTSADNGWKYVLATNTTSPYSFVVDYSLLYGGSVASGDIIQYFVAAQDASNNMNSLPMLATAGANPPIQNITAAPATVNQYVATNVMISGTINVPGTYPTLTGTGGLFQTLNNSLVNGNIVVNITGNLTEPGTFALNPFSAMPENGVFSMTIKPDAAVERTISGTVANGMIRFNGSDLITVDGNYTGAGRFLKFVNTDASNPAFTIENDADFITLKNLTIEGANNSATSGVIFIGGSNCPSGNNDLAITGNVIRNLSTGSGIPNTLICSSGTLTRDNYNITISDNELFNFSGFGINITSSANGNNWTITGNNIYCNLSPAPATAQTGISLTPGSTSGGNTVSNNFIGGSGPGCSGTPWVNASTGFIGITLTMGNALVNTVENNLVRNISLTNASSCSFTGISVSGWTICTGNTVGGTTGTASVNKAGTGTVYGMYFNTGFTQTSEIHNNTIGDLYCNATGMYLTYAVFVYGKVNCSHNIIGNPNAAVSIFSNAAPPSYSPTATMAYGLYANIEGYAGHNTIAGIIQGNTNPGAFNGIYVLSAYPKVIEANQIVNCGPTSASVIATDVTGIQSNMSGTGLAVFKNNVISLGEGVSNNHVYKGINDAGSNGTSEFYNNSIRLGGTSAGSSNSYAYYKSGTGTSVQANNIYADFRTGPGNQYAIGVAATIGPFSSNYNDFYSPDTPKFAVGTNDYSTLAEWQTATANDMNSVSVDPLYHSVIDLQPCAPELEDAGITVSGVDTDFEGVTRGNPPDIGAFEFTLPVASITTGTPDDFCNGEWLTAHSTKSPSTYLWSTGSTNQTIFLNIAENEAGLYSVYVTDEKGCMSANNAEYEYVPEDLVSSYTLLGLREAQLGESNTILNGSMGLTGDGMTAHVKKNAVVNGPGSFVKASFIEAHPTAVILNKIYGPVTVALPVMQYNTRSGLFTNRTVGNNITITIPDNYINLTVGQNSNVTLTGNIFGNIQAGKGSTITFSGNSFDIDNLKSLPGSTLSPVTFAFTEDAIVRVKNKVDMDVYSIVNPAQHKVIFYIGQEYGNPGMLLIKATGAVFNGSAYVPSGQIHVITDGLKTAPALLNGKFIADKILGTGKYVTWNWYDCEGENPDSQILSTETEEAASSEGNLSLQIFPVPNDGLFRIRFSTPDDGTFILRIYNTLGIVIREMKEVAENGTIDRVIDLKPVAPGIYTVMIMNDHTKIIRKVIVE